METKVWLRMSRGLMAALALGMAVPAQAQDAPSAQAGGSEALVIFDFEETAQEWGIPDWAKTSADYVGQQFELSKEVASHGEGSAEMTAEFPGGAWTGAYAEVEMHVTDWSQFSALAVDVYVPETAPAGLQARLILTVGEHWVWTEMNRGLPLVPGQWTTITANLKPGSMDWKFFPEESFRQDIRKVGLRVESDKAPVYSGAVFFDNVRLVK